MSTIDGNQVAAVPAGVAQGKERCAACGRPKSIAAFARTRCGRRHRTCAACMRKASGARSVRRAGVTAEATVVGCASAECGVPTATDLALEARIAGLAVGLREARQAPQTLSREWKIGQLELALVTTVRMRSAAQILRLVMGTDTIAVVATRGETL